MPNKEIKVNLSELQHLIKKIDALKKDMDEVATARKIHEDYFIHNKGKTKEKMKVCEYKTNAGKNNMLLLLGKTSNFFQNTKLVIEEDQDYFSKKIDTLIM